MTRKRQPIDLAKERGHLRGQGWRSGFAGSECGSGEQGLNRVQVYLSPAPSLQGWAFSDFRCSFTNLCLSQMKENAY